MKNTHHLLFEDLAINQKQKCFDNWIHHIKTDGKHSFSLINMLSHTRNYFQATLQHWQTHGSSMKSTYHLLFEDIPINQNQKMILIIGLTILNQLESTPFQ